jgi:fructose-bisphosphate aldolase class II
MTGVLRKFFAENPGEFDPRKYLGEARKAVQSMVEHKIQVLGSVGSAN